MLRSPIAEHRQTGCDEALAGTLRRDVLVCPCVGVIGADRTCLTGAEPADEPCGDGMYYNYETLDCEPWVAVNAYVDPWIPVPIPVWIQSTLTLT